MLKATGSYQAPIALIFKNKDARSKAYRKLKNLFRPSHADFTYQARFGVRDWRGGGRAGLFVSWIEYLIFQQI